MRAYRRIISTFRSLFRKEELDRDLGEELASYLALLTAEKVRAGMSLEQARREARLELGGVEQVKEKVRERRVGYLIDTFFHDLRYAARTLRKNVGFTAVAILILAIGIGASTALFTTIHAVLLRSIPFDEPDRLVVGRKTMDGRVAGPVSRVDYLDYRELNESFEELAALGWFTQSRTMTGGREAQLLRAIFVTWNLFKTLKVDPIVGRSFLLEDEQQGDGNVVLIDHGLWQTRFGGEPGAVGSTIHLDGFAYTIIGVMPRGFRFLFDVDVWHLIDRDVPIDRTRDSHSLLVVGRMKPGVQIEQAVVETGAIAAGLAEAYPETNRGKSLWLTDLHQFMVRGVSLNLQLLMATTALVLLIACANVAGLLLARGERRASEIAMRAALGASRSRLLRQLLTESVVLTCTAGLLGIGVAYLLQDGLLRLLPIGGLGLERPLVNSAALAFTLGVSIASGLLVGVIPALRGTALHPARQLGSARLFSQGAPSRRLQRTYVVMQVAISIALVVGSGTLIRSLAQLSAVDLGFDPRGLLTGQVGIQEDDYATPAERDLFFGSLLEEVQALPGVSSAALISKLPLRDLGTDWPVWPADQPPPTNQASFFAMARWVSPGYFETTGIPLVRGRDISESDGANSYPVIVLSEIAARSLFGESDPVGRTVRVRFSPVDQPFLVIGVVGDIRLNGLRRAPDAAMYMSARQVGGSSMGLIVRTSGDPRRLVSAVDDLVERKDPNVLFARPASMASVVDGWQAGFRVVVTALSLFSTVALILTGVGLYGVLAYHVNQRANEIGIRLAVGASSGQLVRMILGQGWTMVGPGLLLGLLAAYPATLLIRPLLYGIEPFDAPAYVAAIGIIALVTTLAASLPARRATRVNVVDVLAKQ
ncbi:MAG: ABC transporter permease [Gemmatimonadales bacterium]|jgi:putative ABC transport system permease protein